MPYNNQNQNENKNNQQSVNVNSNNWQDEGQQQANENANAHQNANENAPVNEVIPQLTVEEQAALNTWRNSTEMQEGLKAILPKNDNENANGNNQNAPQLDQFVQQLLNESMSNVLVSAIEKETGVSLQGSSMTYQALGTLQPKDKAKIRALIRD